MSNLIEITSKENQQIKFVQSLQEKKNRKEHKLIIVEGKTIILEALKRNFKIKKIFVKDLKILDDCRHLFFDSELYYVSEEIMRKIATTDTAPPILAVFEMLQIEENFDKDFSNIFLFAEDIQDPGNLGSIIRTAFGAGVAAIYLSPNSADIFNTKTIRSSMGAIFAGSIQYLDLETLITKLKIEFQASCEIIGTSPRADFDYHQIAIKANKNFLLLVGNETRGLSQSAMDQCTTLVKIPLNKNIESLNVLAATSIILFKFRELISKQI